MVQVGQEQVYEASSLGCFILGTIRYCKKGLQYRFQKGFESSLPMQFANLPDRYNL